ncbi:MAG: SBBP repeat-containing protein [Acidobacteriota bacterium]
MSRKSRITLFATLVVTASLTLAAPFNSLTLLASAFTRNAAAINKPPLASATTPEAAAKARVAENYGKLPLQFEANEGQFNNQARFVSRGHGYNLSLTRTSAALSLRSNDGRAVVEMQPLNANPNPTITGVDKLPGVSNYFRGNNPTKWRTNVPHFAKVKYEAVYPGVDLVYYGNQRQLEYDFVVAPGVDPNKIKLGFVGADEIKLADNGDLVLMAKGSELRQHKPVIYQEVNSQRSPVAGSFVIEGKNRVRFEVGEYDASKVLVIDPTLNYSTFLGGSDGNDKGYAIAVDSSGNSFITGETLSTDFPAPGSPFQTDQTDTDVFVTKMNSTGTGVGYSTYIGGSSVDIGHGIAADSSGNAYVAGETSSTDFPASSGAYRTSNEGGVDAFVFKLDSSGGRSFATYLGGDNDDRAYGLALNTSDSTAYIVGETNSNSSGGATPFPTTSGARQTTNAGGYDIFFTRVNSSGTSLSYSTYLGGSTNDYGRAIAVQSSNAYLTGIAQSTNFPTSSGAWDAARNGLQDAFVAKINPAGGGSTDLVYSTYLGGDGRESGFGIAADGDGKAYITGETVSAADDISISGYDTTKFPVTNGAVQTTNAGGVDVFVTKLNPAGGGSSDIVYSTLLGDSEDDIGYAITLDGSNNAIITGETNSTAFPVAPSPSLQGNCPGLDAFVTKLNSTGTTISFSTYHCGGAGAGGSSDSGRGVAFVSSAIYVTGFTDSISDQDGGSFPAKPTYDDTPTAYQPSQQGGYDAFVVKITP